MADATTCCAEGGRAVGGRSASGAVRRRRTVVIKVGGSVLRGPAGFREAARSLARRLDTCPDERLVVVVSAEHGLTDGLLDQAKHYTPEPDRETLDLLWATGELRSVALLTLALQACGVRAAALNVHQNGLLALDCAGEATRLRPSAVLARLDEHEVVVLPGFLAVTADATIVSLGRGGSDLSAVLVAAGLGAGRCELIKDVDGYYEKDPARYPGTPHLPTVDWETALRLADAGCELVQRRALVAARDHRVPLVIGAWSSPRTTVVGGGESAEPSRRLAAPHL